MDQSKLAVAVFDKRADEYEQKFMDVSHYSESLDLFCDYLPGNRTDILEVACGPGNITAYLLNKRKDLKILGLDLAPNMIMLAQKNNPEASFLLMDCRDIKQLHKKYDGIVCGFCLPYLNKEEAIQLIENASSLLKRDGLFYLSTMEDDYEKSGMQTNSAGDKLWMHYHQADYLLKALEKQQFNVIFLKRMEILNTDKSEAVDLIIVAKKLEQAM